MPTLPYKATFKLTEDQRQIHSFPLILIRKNRAKPTAACCVLPYHVQNSSILNKMEPSPCKMTSLCSNISSIECDVHMCTEKVWTAINRLSTICKSNLPDEIRILTSCSNVSTIVWQHHLDFKDVLGKKQNGN